MLFVNQAVDSAHFHVPPFQTKAPSGGGLGKPPNIWWIIGMIVLVIIIGFFAFWAYWAILDDAMDCYRKLF